uniref:hypothetical protein n=1 Tax=uncultured Draconibacterium sp. TaxID=1573823 RepID=UPI0032175119
MDYLENITDKKKLQNDEILEFLKEISHKDYGFPSGLEFIPYEDFMKGIRRTSKLPADINKESWGLLSGEYSKMHGELGQLITDFMNFYDGRTDTSNYTPQQINAIINYYMLRIRRIGCVLNPEYSLISSYEKKSKFTYHMVKGYYINDEGKRVRSLSRNVANTEAAIEDIVAKVLKLNVKGVEIFEPDNVSGAKPDMVVIESKKKWAVEIKSKDKETIIRAYVGFEMWKLYKEQYDLLV